MAPLDSQPLLHPRRSSRTPVVFIAALAACSLFAIFALAGAVLSGPVPALVSLVLAVLPVPLVIAGVLFLDRLEPEPPVLLMLVFGAGAGVAALIVLAGHALGAGSIATPELGPHANLVRISLGAALAGALVAESLKGAVLAGLLRFCRQELDGTHDGVVYGSMVGLGFAFVANLHAYVQARPSGASALASQFVLRGILSPLWDPLFSSMIGVGIAYAAMRRGAGGLWAVGVGWAAAVGLHTLWDDSVAAGPGEATAVYVILLCALTALLLAVVVDRRRIIALITRHLPAYQAPGVLGASDVTMLSSMRGRRQARQWARLHRGGHGVRAMADYQLAATELVLAFNRASRNLVEQARFTTASDEALATMRAASSLIRGAEPSPPPWAAAGTSAFGPQQPQAGQMPSGSVPPGAP